MNNVVSRQQKPKKMKLWAKILIGVAIAAGVFWQGAPIYGAVFGGPSISDRITVWSFEPTKEIAELADKSGMNDHGQFLFFAGQPQLNDRETFNYNCADVIHPETVVLGCYNGRIFIFNVTDERLDGIKAATAAHEMLHLAWDRLGSIEQARVSQLIERQLSQTTDDRILEQVKLYDQTEPGQRINELHSIFATEVRDINPELEQYYSRYFAERLRAVEASEKYEKIFTELQDKADGLMARLETLDAEIDSRRAAHESIASQLSLDIDNFNNCADTWGCFASESSFYIARNGLIVRQNALNAEADAVNALVNEYNQIVVDLQALGYEVESLRSSINSQSLLE